MLPECGSDLQVRAGISRVALWELDSRVDEGLSGNFVYGEILIKCTAERADGVVSCRLQSPTIRRFKRDLKPGTECIRRRKSDDFSGSDILEFCA